MAQLRGMQLGRDTEGPVSVERVGGTQLKLQPLYCLFAKKQEHLWMSI